jgi:hypothetical protein
MGEHRADRQQCEIVGNVRNVGRLTYLSSTLCLSSIAIDGAFVSLLHEPLCPPFPPHPHRIQTLCSFQRCFRTPTIFVNSLIDRLTQSGNVQILLRPHQYNKEDSCQRIEPDRGNSWRLSPGNGLYISGHVLRHALDTGKANQ